MVRHYIRVAEMPPFREARMCADGRVRGVWIKGHPNLNLHHTEETKAKIKAHHSRYWLGKGKGGMSGKHQSDYQKAKTGELFRGKKRPPEVNEKNRLGHIGLKQTIKTRKKRSEVMLAKYGTKTPADSHWRNRLQYKVWKKTVLERDDFTCQNCRKRGGKLEADHIKPWALYPELRFDISNGRTLCPPCHLEIGWRGSWVK